MRIKCDVCQGHAEYILKRLSNKTTSFLCEKDLVKFAEDLIPQLWVARNGIILCNKHKRVKGFPLEDLVATEQGACYYCLVEGGG